MGGTWEQNWEFDTQEECPLRHKSGKLHFTCIFLFPKIWVSQKLDRLCQLLFGRRNNLPHPIIIPLSQICYYSQMSLTTDKICTKYKQHYIFDENLYSRFMMLSFGKHQNITCIPALVFVMGNGVRNSGALLSNIWAVK